MHCFPACNHASAVPCELVAGQHASTMRMQCVQSALSSIWMLFTAVGMRTLPTALSCSCLLLLLMGLRGLQRKAGCIY